MKTKLRLYVAIAGLQQVSGLTWVEALYNDPSMIHSKTAAEWAVVASISALNVALGMCIVWKAYLSDPNIINGKASTNETKSDPPIADRTG